MARIPDPISRYVDDKLTVVVLANLAEADPGKIAGARGRDLFVREGPEVKLPPAR